MAKKKGSLLEEFKKFISRGNVMDMAVGIIIGTAFTAIVSSLVKDILMPFISLIIGGINFTDLKIVIAQATADTAEVAITYGTFIQKVIDFLIIAFVVFMMIRTLNLLQTRLKKQEEQQAAAEEKKPAPPAPDIVLLTEIRDLLKNK
ncbi:MAG: Large-conductance mechanosensitive channel [Spirochaetes bacterium ADurb.Bin315]|nr:MAG: Large-conductance mechanosensitive channel [Spirochaetes bacterium ADurb.Bin315]HOR80174.1 large-conductance mechanosensitive channel protein MscL [Sphaerochaeta sp.]